MCTLMEQNNLICRFTHEASGGSLLLNPILSLYCYEKGQRFYSFLNILIVFLFCSFFYACMIFFFDQCISIFMLNLFGEV